jgi:hypothetical protein
MPDSVKRPPCEVDQLKPSLRQLTPPRFRVLTDRLGWNQGRPTNLVTPGEAAYLWTAQWLGTEMSNDHVDLLLSHFGDAIQSFGDTFHHQLFDTATANLTIAHLMVADRRYAAMAGTKDCIDLTSGDVREDLERVPAVVLSYNLGEIYRRSVASLNRQVDNSGESRHGSHINAPYQT